MAVIKDPIYADIRADIKTKQVSSFYVDFNNSLYYEELFNKQSYPQNKVGD